MSLSMSKHSQLDKLNDKIAIFMTLTKKYIAKYPYYLYNIYIVKQKKINEIVKDIIRV